MILITRPKKQAEKTLKKLQELGFEGRIASLLKIKHIKNALQYTPDYENIIVTSIHAAKVIAKHGRFKNSKFYVVGAKVANFLRQNGYTVVEEVSTATSIYPPAHAIHVSGDHIALDFGRQRVVVYKSIACTTLPEIDGIDTILFYSPRTARVFKNLSPNNLEKITAICISYNTALPLKDLAFKQILIAENPDEKSMFRLL